MYRFRVALAHTLMGAGVGLFVTAGAVCIGGDPERNGWAGSLLAVSPLVMGAAVVVLPLRSGAG